MGLGVRVRGRGRGRGRTSWEHPSTPPSSSTTEAMLSAEGAELSSLAWLGLRVGVRVGVGVGVRVRVRVRVVELGLEVGLDLALREGPRVHGQQQHLVRVRVWVGVSVRVPASYPQP